MTNRRFERRPGGGLEARQPCNHRDVHILISIGETRLGCWCACVRSTGSPPARLLVPGPPLTHTRGPHTHTHTLTGPVRQRPQPVRASRSAPSLPSTHQRTTGPTRTGHAHSLPRRLRSTTSALCVLVCLCVCVCVCACLRARVYGSTSTSSSSPSSLTVDCWRSDSRRPPLAALIHSPRLQPLLIAAVTVRRPTLAGRS